MFCPKCGTKNPDNGRFCRSCRTSLSVVSEALSGKSSEAHGISAHGHRRKKRVSWESAMGKLFMGFAFLAVAIILGITGRGGHWWFWLLIPALSMIGAGVARVIQLRQDGASGVSMSPTAAASELEGQAQAGLPPVQTDYSVPDSRYKTGDLTPASVAENTTRKLEIDKDGETMTLPKVDS